MAWKAKPDMSPSAASLISIALAKCLAAAVTGPRSKCECAADSRVPSLSSRTGPDYRCLLPDPSMLQTTQVLLRVNLHSSGSTACAHHIFLQPGGACLGAALQPAQGGASRGNTAPGLHRDGLVSLLGT